MPRFISITLISKKSTDEICKLVLGIRIRVRIFLGLQDQDSLVRGMDPDPAPDLDPSLFS